MEKIQNKGTGAGGANTNVNGKAFEDKTNNEQRLLENGFVRNKIPGKSGKYDYYLKNESNSIVYVSQGGLKSYFDYFFEKKIERNPDEAYIKRVGNTFHVKILEKKNQNVEGSVIDKLMNGECHRSEMEFAINDERFKVEYAYCLSNFLKKSYMSDSIKMKHLRKWNTDKKIQVFFGEDEDYFSKLDAWISS
jgi:hypothetical protein